MFPSKYSNTLPTRLGAGRSAPAVPALLPGVPCLLEAWWGVEAPDDSFSTPSRPPRREPFWPESLLGMRKLERKDRGVRMPEKLPPRWSMYPLSTPTVRSRASALFCSGRTLSVMLPCAWCPCVVGLVFAVRLSIVSGPVTSVPRDGGAQDPSSLTCCRARGVVSPWNPLASSPSPAASSTLAGCCCCESLVPPRCACSFCELIGR